MKIQSRIALFGRRLDKKWNNRINILLSALEKKGVRLCYYDELLSSLKEIDDIHIPDGEIFSSHLDLPDDISLLLSLGGDGTFLSSLTVVRDRPVPVAGINFGRLGFLTTAMVSEDSPNKWIDCLFNHCYKIDKKPTLRLTCDQLPIDFYPFALNEISIQRGDPFMIGIELKINGMVIPTYWADGLLIATSTGSTAYSLSVGGPIVAPGSDVFIISPIASHNLNVRPLIVPDNSLLDINIISKNGDAVISIDNRSFKITDKCSIHILKGECSMNYISFDDSNFFIALQQKLLWGGDKRNS